MPVASLLAALAATAPLTTPAVPAQAATPLEQAAAYCEWQVIGADGRFEVPAGSNMYIAMDPAVAAQLRAMGKGRTIGQTTADLPDLVKRFVATQPMGQTAQVDPMSFDYLTFGGAAEPVWTIGDRKAHACDVMVTRSPDFVAQRDALVAKLLTAGWQQRAATGLDGAPFWTTTLSKPLAAGGELHLRAEGLPTGTPEDGVQMALQFTQATLAAKNQE